MGDRCKAFNTRWVAIAARDAIYAGHDYSIVSPCTRVSCSGYRISWDPNPGDETLSRPARTEGAAVTAHLRPITKAELEDTLYSYFDISFYFLIWFLLRNCSSLLCGIEINYLNTFVMGS